jgi:predicted SAM-dependent methyltransferase
MSGFRQRLRALRRLLSDTDGKLRTHYLAKASAPKLQIGGGWHLLEGWLNTDLGEVPGVMQMDATTAYPFADGTFACVYSEHMIEHVSLSGGQAMLRECHRVLRDGGLIRIVTPDLKALLGLYDAKPGGLAKRYQDFFHQAFADAGYPRTATGVINAQFRLWGHQFIYDEATLIETMAAAGFKDIVRKPLGQSDHMALTGLENQSRYPEDLLNFESIALEGRK